MLMQGIFMLKNLRILSLQSNRISIIPNLNGLVHLEELYFSHNRIEELPVDCLPSSLTTLDLANNRIGQLTHMKHLKNLEDLWINHNLLSSYEEIESELKYLESLRTVYFEGNPLEADEKTRYRAKVKYILPQVTQIDATLVAPKQQ